MEIADSLKKDVFWIEKVSYSTSLGGNITYNSKQIYWTLLWVSKDYFKVKEHLVQNWTYFSNSNYENNDKVVILGNDIVKENFWEENVIWKTIFIAWTPFVVQWTIKEWDWTSNYSIFVPITTAVNRLWWKELKSIEILVDRRLDISNIKLNLQYYFFKASWISSPADATFEIKTNEDALKQINKIIGQMKLLLWAIGSIALVVWWIWIMNIMLVSVTERTKEIWIRKAIWATKTSILLQFLIESIILSIIGCIIAVIFCYWITYLISKSATDFQAVITSSVLILASSVSICMWIIFGLMPAWKAARLKPIDALRWE
jgi:ABC-type antimicrobial peptide transport system permease subunit